MGKPAALDSLDYSETLAAVARLAVPEHADWCFVELLMPDGRIERVVKEHVDPSKRAFIEEYDRRYPLDPDSPVGSPKVIRTGEPELMAEIPPEFWAAVTQDPEQHRLMREVGIVSALVVPMRVRGTVIGDIALAHSVSGRRYGEADLARAQDLADRCALAIDNARLHTEARRSRDDLEAILEGVADAVTAQAPDGRLVYANDAAVRLLGFADAQELLAAPPASFAARFTMRDEHGEVLPFERLPGRAALRGERPAPLTVRYRHVSGEDRWSRVQSTPVFDEAGRVRLAINVIEDITEIMRAGQGQRFLADASNVLSRSLDFEETLRSVARLAVPAMADWCAVDVLIGEQLVRVAVEAGGDPRPEPPRLVRHAELYRDVGGRSMMLAPMTLHDRVLGVITLVAAESGRRYDEHDLALVENLALRAAAAVENARLYETASKIARTLQTSLLPPSLPEPRGAELAAAYQPAGSSLEVGGDFYDVFSTEDDQWYLVVGDVCGKGAEAAAVTALARYTIRAAAVGRRSPAAILRWLSDVMVQQSDGGDDRYCTIACAHVDLGRSPARVTLACGGHPLPLLVRADGSAEEVGIPGTLLGLVPHPDVHDHTSELHEGDTLLLYTDGLTEAGAPGHVLSPQELAAAATDATGDGVAELVRRLVTSTMGDLPTVRDDVAVLGLRARSGS